VNFEFPSSVEIWLDSLKIIVGGEFFKVNIPFFSLNNISLTKRLYQVFFLDKLMYKGPVQN
jgi:hypothetical protein